MGQRKSKQKADNKEEATGESVAKENNETKPETTNQAGEIEDGKEKEEQAGETTKETSADENPGEVASTEQKTEEKEHTSDESQKKTEIQEQADGDEKCIQEPTKPVQSVTPENIDKEMKQTEDKSGGDDNAQVPSPEAASSEDLASPVTNSQEKVAESIKSSEIQSAEGTNDGTLVEESETKLTEGQSLPVSETVYPATFIWDGEGKEVGVSGSFNNWGDPWSLSESDGKFSLTKSLAAGQYHYKFYVDGNQTVNSNQPMVQLDHHGEVNVMTVESTRSDE